MCLQWDSQDDNFRLLLESKGKIGDVEHFDVTASSVSQSDSFLLNGSAHRHHRKKLHLGLTGTWDDDGPAGAGSTAILLGYDVSYNPKKEKGVSSYINIEVEKKDTIIDTLTKVSCSSLPKPAW